MVAGVWRRRLRDDDRRRLTAAPSWRWSAAP